MALGWTWPGAAVIAALVAPAYADRSEPDPIEQTADHLARRWAPVYVQHVDGKDRGRDRPTRIDFDGNWDATDNWDHQAELGTRLPPAAYSAAILTTTHAYLTYTLYYPRDWSWFCVSLVCHDNDLETVQLVVKRDAVDGELVGIRTKAHHSMADVPADKVARSDDGRPMLKVEAQGHGVSVCKKDDPGCTSRPGRLIYFPGTPSAAPPKQALGQTVPYELLSMRDTLWAHRAQLTKGLWTSGESGPLFYRGLHRGRLGHAMGVSMATSRYVGGVRPPWGLKGPTGRRGDWFLDPASTRERAATYEYNPYLDDLSAECKGSRCRPAPPEPSRAGYLAKLGLKRGGPYVAVALGVVVVTSLLRSRGAEMPF